MFVRTIDELKGTDKHITMKSGNGQSIRLLLADDGMGFSLSDVYLVPGTVNKLWYKNHWEANYVVAGNAALEDRTTGETWALSPGSLYMVGPNDRHIISTDQDVQILSIFNPPVTGNEYHDEDGGYPPTGPVPPGPERMFVRSVAAMRATGKEKVVAGGSARTARMLLKDDGLGFTVCDVNLAPGNKNVLWYKNHWEANHIIGGSGEVTDLTSGEVWPLVPGTMYCVGPNDRHSMHAITDLHLISVFCPALQGDEMHDEDGALAPSGPVPPGPSG